MSYWQLSLPTLSGCKVCAPSLPSTLVGLWSYGYLSKMRVVPALLSGAQFSALKSDGQQDYRITWPDSPYFPSSPENFLSVSLCSLGPTFAVSCKLGKLLLKPRLPYWESGAQAQT